MIKALEFKKPLKSPLRYPGGKAFLAPYVEGFFEINGLTPDVFVEPFAGGASLSLHLLGKGLVDQIALYDLDPVLHGFWWTVFRRSKPLLERIQSTPITIDEWHEQKEAVHTGKTHNAWKCLFLNRTSFSGILAQGAGPLGGKSQQSRYLIDCRFNTDAVVQQIEALWDMRNSVKEVDCLDWYVTLQKYKNSQNVFLYLDPPFFYQANRLYNYYFEMSEHRRVVSTLAQIQTPWMLSYDYCEESEALFQDYDLNYIVLPVKYTSGLQNGNASAKKEIVASNLLLPTLEEVQK